MERCSIGIFLESLPALSYSVTVLTHEILITGMEDLFIDRMTFDVFPFRRSADSAYHEKTKLLVIDSFNTSSTHKKHANRGIFHEKYFIFNPSIRIGAKCLLR